MLPPFVLRTRSKLARRVTNSIPARMPTDVTACAPGPAASLPRPKSTPQNPVASYSGSVLRAVGGAGSRVPAAGLAVPA